MKKTVILGAGLAGLAAGSRLGEGALILEAADDAGGAARTYFHDGFGYDLGPHVLYFKRKDIRNWVEKALGGEWKKQKRKARIAVDGEEVGYPLQEGFLESRRLRERFLSGLLGATAERAQGFGETCRNLYGKAMAEAFFLPYNSKLFRYPLDEMDACWQKRFLPAFPKGDLAMIAEGKEMRRGPNEGFYYPAKGGIGMLSKKLAYDLSDNLRLNTKVVAVNTSEGLVETESGERVRYDALISTLALPELAGMCIDLPRETREMCTKLKSVGMIFVFLGLAKPLTDDSHWKYFPDPEIFFHRISIPVNYSRDLTPVGKGSVVAEVSFRSDEEPRVQDIVERTKSDLTMLGIVSEKDIVSTDVRLLKHAYVFATRESEEARKSLARVLEEKAIVLAGRYGVWEYGNMESAVAQGLDAAERIREK